MPTRVATTSEPPVPWTHAMDPNSSAYGHVGMAMTNPSEMNIVAPNTQPLDGLQANAPPPFLTKTYDMVEDPSTDMIVSWSESNNSFIVWNTPEFARDLLPKYFKHNNFSSFVRQLNTYGFRKVDPDRWEFANEGFLRGQRHLLRSIQRRKPAPHNTQASTIPPGNAVQTVAGLQPTTVVEVGKYGLEGELERLKRDKHLLMSELVRLRQQQQTTDRDLRLLSQRMNASEQRQQQMMQFLAKAMQNPSFLAQLVQQNENRRQAIRKKRRLPKQQSQGNGEGDSKGADGQIIKYTPQDGSTDPLRMFMPLGFPQSPSGRDIGSADFLRELQNMGLETSNRSPSAANNRPSGVKLEEMLPSVSPADPHIAAAGMNQGSEFGAGMDLSQSLLVHGSKMSHLDMPSGFDMSQNLGSNLESMMMDNVSVGGSGQMEEDVNGALSSDLFWQQFLSEGQQTDESCGLNVDVGLSGPTYEQGGEDIGVADESWWVESSELAGDYSADDPIVPVETLTEQMGSHSLDGES